MIPQDPETAGRADAQPDAGALAVGVVRTTWPWILGALAAVGFVLFLLWGANRPDDPALPPAAAGGTPATPADGLNFTEVARLIGETCARLLVADTPDERESGLRHREIELERLEGMLFVHEAPQTNPGFFTMAGVEEGLAVGFYGPDGARIGGHEMVPCDGTVEACPRYAAPEGWQFAIETAPGQLPEGNLGGECTPGAAPAPA